MGHGMETNTVTRTMAAKAGLPRYTGKPCRKCGGTLRYVVNCDCVACSANRTKLFNRKIRALRAKASQ